MQIDFSFSVVFVDIEQITDEQEVLSVSIGMCILYH